MNPVTNSINQWSIGLYKGSSPFTLEPVPDNPIIQAQDITGLEAGFVADPFMLQHQGEWFLFFEILPATDALQQNPKHENGTIGLAKSSDGVLWEYQGIILEEPWHLSYPHVFETGGEHYMIPETLGANHVTLYKALSFPDKWMRANNLLSGQHADATPFFYDDKWWMFTCPAPDRHDTLDLYYAEDLSGPWCAHPANPIIKNNPRQARPAGRVINWENKLFRFAQDCFPRYGTQVRAFEITELSPKTYAETEHPQSPILRPTGHGWNGRNMHHIDLHRLDQGNWIACVDGYYSN